MKSQHRYQLGDKIGGRFQVCQALMGGMGEVYLCLDLEQDIPLALKIFQTRYLGSPRIHELFKREVANWITLGDHPNIVHCYSMEFIDNQPFILLEWIAGDESYRVDLRSWLRQGPLGLRLALDFALDICRGLIHVNHQVPGLVHRDLKPDNILVDGAQIAKITDFGLATIVQESSLTTSSPPILSGERQSLIASGGIVGTPAYMAPEQWRGEKVDTRTDIYALGCILYEMLTGRMAFVATTVEELKRQHLTVLIPKLAENVSVPKALDELVSKCLAKQKEQRIASAKDLFEELECIYRRVFSEEPRVVSPSYGLTTAGYINRGQTYAQVQRYHLALSDFTHAIQMEPHSALPYVARSAFLLDLLRYEEALADISRALELEPRLAVSYHIRGSIFLATCSYRAALKDLHLAIELDPALAAAYAARGSYFSQQGEIEVALRDFQEAIKLAPDYPLSYLHRSIVYCLTQRAEDAWADIVHAFELAPYMPPSYNAIACATRSQVSLELRRFEEAFADAERAIEVLPNQAGAYALRGQALIGLQRYQQAMADLHCAVKMEPNSSHVYLYRSRGHMALKRYDEALADLDHAIGIAPRSASAYAVRGGLYLDLHRYHEALVDLDHAIQLAPTLALAYAFRGGLYTQMMNPSQALVDLDQAIALAPRLAVAYINRAKAYTQLQHPYEALADLNRVTEWFPHLLPNESFAVHLNRGSAYMLLEQHDEALRDINQALQFAEQLPQHCSGMAYSARGVAHLLHDDYKAAYADISHAIQLAPGSPEPYLMMGTLLDDLGRTEEAEMYLGKAVQLGLPQTVLDMFAEGFPE